ncbi:UNVERIFIED_CONTAM: hypothetical protein K2H54_060188 [Gekko kuhli]
MASPRVLASVLVAALGLARVSAVEVYTPNELTVRNGTKFFYYSNGKGYPGRDVPFRDRISWAGDLSKKDVSISIADIQFQDTGTYVCDVRNPPDIVATPGEIRLRVVVLDMKRDHLFWKDERHKVV